MGPFPARLVLLGALSVLASASATAAPCQESTVPFEQPGALHGQGPIVFRGHVQGLEVRLVLDTGASRSVLDSAVAKRLGLPEGIRLPAGGVGGVGQVSTLLVPGLRVGDFEFPDFAAAAMDLSFVDLDGLRLDGIFGSDLLRECMLEVDFARHSLRFSPLEWGDTVEGFTFLPLGWLLGIPVLEAAVDGLPAMVLVDTGNLAFTVLHGPFFRRHFEAPAGPTVHVQGVGGESPVVLGRLGSLEIAGRRFAALPCVAPAPGAAGGLLNVGAADGNIGVATLRHFRVLFDYARDRIGLAPGPEWPEVPRGQPGFSFRWREGGFEVRDVLSEAAAAAGLSPGDRLVQVDERDVAGLRTPDLLPLIHGEPGTRVAVAWHPAGEPGVLRRAILERRDWFPLFTRKAAAE